MLNRIRQIDALGQALWLDYISRPLVRGGELAALVEEGVLGVTSNPTIFQKAIAESADYDDDIRRLGQRGLGLVETYEELALGDVGEAADILRRVYNERHGRDGFVSIEVNPELAHDTAGAIAEGRRLWARLNRPNIMIKVPATPAGLPAITALIGEGINVNVTLIFSVAMHERVMQAYIDGLRQFSAQKRPLGTVSSVASFFVSRVDTLIDKLLDQKIAGGEEHLEYLRGRAAVANSKLAYAAYKRVFEGPGFEELRRLGARVQRPLWASTSTKNPRYPATKYIDPLIGMNTVNTVPPPTLESIRNEAVAAQTIEQDLHDAQMVIDKLHECGIDMHAVTDQLLREGVEAFANSFRLLMQDLEGKRSVVLAGA